MRMVKGICVSVLAAVFLLAGSPYSNAFEQEGVAQGNKEIAAYLLWFKANPDDGDSFDAAVLGGTFGYFITDPLEVGAYLQILSSDDATPWTLSPFVRYHFFYTPTTTPYVGGSLSFTDPDIEGEDLLLGLNLNAGVNVFMTENTAISPELNYGIYSDYTLLTMLVQLKYFF